MMIISFTKFIHNGTDHMGMSFMIELDNGNLCSFSVPGYMTDADQAYDFALTASGIESSIRHLLDRLGREVPTLHLYGDLCDMIRAEWAK